MSDKPRTLKIQFCKKPVDSIKRNKKWCVRAINLTQNHQLDDLSIMESLILAQDERWQCALDMQVERSALNGDLRIKVYGDLVANG